MHPKRILTLMFLVACLLIGQGSGLASPLTYFAVSFGGTTLYSETDALAYPFTLFTFNGVKATSDTSVLQFTFTQEAAYYNLDDVVIVPASAETDGYSPCGSVVGNLVLNCGFEAGAFTDWTRFGTVAFDSVTPEDTYAGVFPYSGTYMAEFGNPDSDSGISQSIGTTADTLYNISFYLENDGGAETPEPAPVGLFMSGLAGLGLLAARRRR